MFTPFNIMACFVKHTWFFIFLFTIDNYWDLHINNSIISSECVCRVMMVVVLLVRSKNEFVSLFIFPSSVCCSNDQGCFDV